MPTLTWTVEVSFTAPYTTPTWVDITTWVQSFKSTLGRQHELQRTIPSTLTLTLDNRDARFNTWNTTGPYAAMGAGLVPQMPIRVRATWNAVTYPVYFGYVDSWTPVYPNPVSSELTIGATDMLGMLAVSSLTSTAYKATALADTPTGYYRLDDMSTPTCADSSGNNHNATYQGTVTLNNPGALLGDTDTSVDLAGTGYVNLPPAVAPTGNASWSIEMWIKLDAAPPVGGGALWFAAVGQNIGGEQLSVLITTAAQVQVLAVAGGTQTINMATAANTVKFDGLWHHVVATWDGSRANIYYDGALSVTFNYAHSANLAAFNQCYLCFSPGYGAANLQVDEHAIYPTTLTAAKVLNHYQIGGFAYAVQLSGDRVAAAALIAGVPSGMVSLNGHGISVVQGATSTLVGTMAADYIQTIVTTEQGEIIQSTTGNLTFYDRHYVLVTSTSTTSQGVFEDSASSNFFYRCDGFTPGLDNLDLWNEVTASAQAGIGTPAAPTGAPQTYRNQASINQYGKRTYPPLSGLLVTTDAEVLSLAQWVGNHYSTPLPRVRSITMDSAINAGGDLPQMLGRSFLDRVTVIYHGNVGGTAFTQDSLIEGIEHDVNVDPGLWTTTFRLSPAETQQYLILNDAIFGKLDSNRLGY